MDLIQTQYRSNISAVCRDALASASDLKSALHLCRGLFPTLAIEEFLGLDRQWTLEKLKSQREELNSVGSSTHEGSSFVLSTWEYSDSCIEYLIERSWGSDSRVCLIGCPTLVSYLPVRESAYSHLLIDLRTPVAQDSQKFRHLRYDVNCLSGEEFEGLFDTCFIDPPWYVDSYHRWIDIAVSYCRQGGLVAFSLLGSMTRPSAIEDRERILEHCESRGLEIRIYEDAILYDVPEFEQAMLRRAGVPIFPWKRADLVVGRLAAKPDLGGVDLAGPVAPFGHVVLSSLSIDVVFDRHDLTESRNLSAGVGGYWMVSPSRRERGLSDCNVFTSNGARFIAAQPFDLYCKLRSLSDLDDQAVHSRLVELGFPQDVVEDAFGPQIDMVRLSI